MGGKMGLAEQLNIEPELACATDQVHVDAPLDSNRNPFTSTALGSRLGRPIQIASGELVRLIGLRTPVVVVLGKPGTGKTVLVSMVERVCADMGLSVRRIERGDLLTEAAGDASDVLFVDEADSMSNAVLQSVLTSSDTHADRTIVFLCLPSSISRFNFSGTEAVVLELSPLSFLDARLYLTERGNSIGRPHLFTPQALDVVIDASRGVPRLLRSIASLAYFNAAVAGASQIDVTHAEAAARMRNEFAPAPSAAAPGLSSGSKPAESDNRSELQALDSEICVVVPSVGTAGSVAENEPVGLSQIEFFGRSEIARDRWSSRDVKSTVALTILLLLAGGASGFALMSGTPRNTESQTVSRPPAIAVAHPAEVAASQASSQRTPATIMAPIQASPAIAVARPAAGASKLSTEEPHTAEAAPTQSTPVSASASTVSASRPAPTKGQNTRRERPRAARVVTQSEAASRRRPAPGQIALPGDATLRAYTPPPAPRAAEADQVRGLGYAVPAAEAVAAPQSTPAEAVRTTARALPPAQNPTEPPLRPDLPAIAADKVQTQQRGDVARAAPDATQREEAVPPERDHLPIIIFGYRLRD